MSNLLNLELPLGIVPSTAPKQQEKPAAEKQAERKERDLNIKVHLPGVRLLCVVGDRVARDSNELISIAQEAQGLARLALIVYDADRLCSWLDPVQRQALFEYLRALNLLSVEAHLRATTRIPTSPGPLPIRRLCGYMLLFRDELPKFMRRLRLDIQDPCYASPRPTDLSDYNPSMATMADIKRSVDGIFSHAYS